MTAHEELDTRIFYRFDTVLQPSHHEWIGDKINFWLRAQLRNRLDEVT